MTTKLTLADAKAQDKWWVRVWVEPKVLGKPDQRSKAWLYRGDGEQFPQGIVEIADDPTGDLAYERMILEASTPSDAPGKVEHPSDSQTQASEGYPREVAVLAPPAAA